MAGRGPAPPLRPGCSLSLPTHFLHPAPVCKTRTAGAWCLQTCPQMSKPPASALGASQRGGTPVSLGSWVPAVRPVQLISQVSWVLTSWIYNTHCASHGSLGGGCVPRSHTQGDGAQRSVLHTHLPGNTRTRQGPMLQFPGLVAVTLVLSRPALRVSVSQCPVHDTQPQASAIIYFHALCFCSFIICLGGNFNFGRKPRRQSPAWAPSPLRCAAWAWSRRVSGRGRGLPRGGACVPLGPPTGQPL